jgi:riboflavin synthase
MFTGIIYCLGTILKISRSNNQLVLRVKSALPIKDLQLGESVAINGGCLTVTNFAGDWFEVYASHETVNCTNLKDLRAKKLVNLERAIMPSDRIGGHIVKGHVDEVAAIKKIQKVGESKLITIEVSKKNAAFLVEKGSVCLDGISLTIVGCSKQFLQVNLIPETLSSTTASNWRVGYELNVEIDALAKLVNNSAKKDSVISKNFLANHGFL